MFKRRDCHVVCGALYGCLCDDSLIIDIMIKYQCASVTTHSVRFQIIDMVVLVAVRVMNTFCPFLYHWVFDHEIAIPGEP